MNLINVESFIDLYQIHRSGTLWNWLKTFGGKYLLDLVGNCPDRAAGSHVTSFHFGQFGKYFTPLKISFFENRFSLAYLKTYLTHLQDLDMFFCTYITVANFQDIPLLSLCKQFHSGQCKKITSFRRISLFHGLLAG